VVIALHVVTWVVCYVGGEMVRDLGEIDIFLVRAMVPFIEWYSITFL
jgi:hypothetical protein